MQFAELRNYISVCAIAHCWKMGNSKTLSLLEFSNVKARDEWLRHAATEIHDKTPLDFSGSTVQS